MEAKFKADNPDEIEMTLTVTMSLRAWRKLYDQIESPGYPSNNLNKCIRNMIRKGEKHFNEIEETQ